VDPVLEFRTCFPAYRQRPDGGSVALDASLQSASTVCLSKAETPAPAQRSYRYHSPHRRGHAPRRGHLVGAHSLGGPPRHPLRRCPSRAQAGGARESAQEPVLHLSPPGGGRLVAKLIPAHDADGLLRPAPNSRPAQAFRADAAVARSRTPAVHAQDCQIRCSCCRIRLKLPTLKASMGEDLDGGSLDQDRAKQGEFIEGEDVGPSRPVAATK